MIQSPPEAKGIPTTFAMLFEKRPRSEPQPTLQHRQVLRAPLGDVDHEWIDPVIPARPANTDAPV